MKNSVCFFISFMLSIFAHGLANVLVSFAVYSLWFIVYCFINALRSRREAHV